MANTTLQVTLHAYMYDWACFGLQLYYLETRVTWTCQAKYPNIWTRGLGFVFAHLMHCRKRAHFDVNCGVALILSWSKSIYNPIMGTSRIREGGGH